MNRNQLSEIHNSQQQQQQQKVLIHPSYEYVEHWQCMFLSCSRYIKWKHVFLHTQPTVHMVHMTSVQARIAPPAHNHKIHMQTMEKHGDCHENQSINLDPFLCLLM